MVGSHLKKISFYRHFLYGMKIWSLHKLINIWIWINSLSWKNDGGEYARRWYYHVKRFFFSFFLEPPRTGHSVRAHTHAHKYTCIRNTIYLAYIICMHIYISTPGMSGIRDVINRLGCHTRAPGARNLDDHLSLSPVSWFKTTLYRLPIS